MECMGEWVCADARSRWLNVLIFFFNDTATTEIYTLSLHDALPICHNSSSGTSSSSGSSSSGSSKSGSSSSGCSISGSRSEEHTSELQSLTNLVCRLLLEKKKKKTQFISSN